MPLRQVVKICYNQDMSVKKLEPFQIENFFTPELIDLVYKNVDEVMAKGLAEKNDKYADMFKFANNGFITLYKGWDNKLSNAIKNKAQELGQNSIPPSNTILIFARYTRDSGGPPNLVPHADVVVNKTMYTCTVRLKSTKQWDIYVKDTKFDMPNEGSAVWFTGNQDVHWRPDIDFGPDDYYDILLCQAWSDIDNEEYPAGHKDSMREQESYYVNKYRDMLKNSFAFDRGNNTDCVGISDGQSIDEAYEAAAVVGVDYSKA